MVGSLCLLEGCLEGFAAVQAFVPCLVERLGIVLQVRGNGFRIVAPVGLVARVVVVGVSLVDGDARVAGAFGHCCYIGVDDVVVVVVVLAAGSDGSGKGHEAKDKDVLFHVIVF